MITPKQEYRSFSERLATADIFGTTSAERDYELAWRLAAEVAAEAIERMHQYRLQIDEPNGEEDPT